MYTYVRGAYVRARTCSREMWSPQKNLQPGGQLTPMTPLDPPLQVDS